MLACLNFNLSEYKFDLTETMDIDTGWKGRRYLCLRRISNGVATCNPSRWCLWKNMPKASPRFRSTSMMMMLVFYTVKPRKQGHSTIRTCRLILWEKTPKDKNQKQSDSFQSSCEMEHLLKKFHHSSVNKVLTIDN